MGITVLPYFDQLRYSIMTDYLIGKSSLPRLKPPTTNTAYP